jgi:predicted transcriptional regulator
MENKVFCVLDNNDNQYIWSLVKAGIKRTDARVIVALIIVYPEKVSLQKLAIITGMTFGQVSMSVKSMIERGLVDYEYVYADNHAKRKEKIVFIKGSVEDIITKFKHDVTWNTNIYSTRVKVAQAKIINMGV